MNPEQAVRHLVEKNAANWILGPNARAEMMREVGNIAAQMYHYLQDLALAELDYHRMRLAYDQTFNLIDRIKNAPNAR